MEDEMIDRHILRAVYELELIRDDYEYNKDKRYETIDDILETLLYHYPNIEKELEKETWK